MPVKYRFKRNNFSFAMNLKIIKLFSRLKLSLINKSVYFYREEESAFSSHGSSV